MGAERFFVHVSLVEQFTAAAVKTSEAMRQGPPLNADGNAGVDIGAMCLPGEADRIQGIVDEAIKAGVEVLVGGDYRAARANGGEGQYYPPTVLVVRDATKVSKLRLMQHEIFGPLITIIPFEDDDELVELANGCPFALGSNVFGADRKRVRDVGRRISAGMLACNDFATCYMCQSLPMGGTKDSGFGKFAGVEGLRALCLPKVRRDTRRDVVPFINDVIMA